ncbi:MAG: acetyltransferase [Candidatus Schekmanbacteria bacterium]|nr:acetyltransferase [Candidatus Schekmanbacteria bacterium]
MTQNQNNIIILGGGGHARVLIDLILSSGHFNILGILDSRQTENFLNIPVLGNDDLLPDLYTQGVRQAVIGVGSVKDNSKRNALYQAVKQLGFSIPPLIHPKAILSESNIILSEGVQVMAGAIIQPNVFLGENVIINTGAIIDHDCRIENNAFIAPGVTISGGVSIGENAFIGAGATILQGLKIGKDSLVAAGALVINDVPDKAIVMGVPAK